MTDQEWDQFGGVCGHQHVPENTHWDPGAIDWDTLLPVLEEEMTLIQVRIELASYWATCRGRWVEGTVTENPQARLTRMAQEVFSGAVTMEQKKASIKGLGTPEDLDDLLAELPPMPGWVAVESAPYTPYVSVGVGGSMA